MTNKEFSNITYLGTLINDIAKERHAEDGIVSIRLHKQDDESSLSNEEVCLIEQALMEEKKNLIRKAIREGDVYVSTSVVKGQEHFFYIHGFDTGIKEARAKIFVTEYLFEDNQKVLVAFQTISFESFVQDIAFEFQHLSSFADLKKRYTALHSDILCSFNALVNKEPKA